MTRVEEYDVSKLVEFKGRTAPAKFHGDRVCWRSTITPVKSFGQLAWKVELFNAGGDFLCSSHENTPAAAIEEALARMEPRPEPDEEPWVNVSDSLPPDEAPCWTRDRANRIRRARIGMSSPGGWPHEPWWWGEVGCAVSNGWITHWMLDREPEGPVEA